MAFQHVFIHFICKIPLLNDTQRYIFSCVSFMCTGYWIGWWCVVVVAAATATATTTRYDCSTAVFQNVNNSIDESYDNALG